MTLTAWQLFCITEVLDRLQGLAHPTTCLRRFYTDETCTCGVSKLKAELDRKAEKLKEAKGDDAQS